MCLTHDTNSPTKLGKKSVPYTINLDWLEVTVRQKLGKHYHEYDEQGNIKDIIAFPNNVYLKRLKNKSGHSYKMSNGYYALYDVFFNNKKVAILHTQSRHGKCELSQIKIENFLLYTDSWQDVLQSILDAIQADINNFTRIDIAIDGRGFIDQHLTYRDAVRAGELRKVGRAKTDLKETEQYECEGFNVGARKSGKLLTGYKKGKRITDAKGKGRDHKPYIVDYWRDNGLIQPDEDIEEIERLEMKLTSQRLGKIGDLSIDKLTNYGYLAGLFELECNNFYQWVKATKDTNTTRAKANGIIHPVEWGLLNIKPAFRVAVTKCKSALWSARMSISHQMREYYVNTKFAFWDTCEQSESQLIYCKLMAERYGIIDWFNHKLKDWKKDREYQQAIMETVRDAQIRVAPVT